VSRAVESGGGGKTLLTITAVLTLALTAPVTASPSAATRLFASVRPLQVVTDASLANICTVSSIGERRWLTAAHCVEGDAPTYIMGEQTTPLVVDVTADIAVLATPMASLPALKMAVTAPVTGDAIAVAGYPLGFWFPLYTTGQVASAVTVLHPSVPTYMVIQAAGAPGNSGSPIVDARGDVISVLQVGWTTTFGPVMGGCTFEVLERFSRYFAG
jgi:S1-C subfamily serine protease